MIRIYERSLCQSYASAYRAGIKIGEANTAIGYDMVGTLKVGGDAPSVCL